MKTKKMLREKMLSGFNPGKAGAFPGRDLLFNDLGVDFVGQLNG